jgi:hypothetical protein
VRRNRCRLRKNKNLRNFAKKNASLGHRSRPLLAKHLALPHRSSEQLLRKIMGPKTKRIAGNYVDNPVKSFNCRHTIEFVSFLPWSLIGVVRLRRTRHFSALENRRQEKKISEWQLGRSARQKGRRDSTTPLWPGETSNRFRGGLFVFNSESLLTNGFDRSGALT